MVRKLKNGYELHFIVKDERSVIVELCPEFDPTLITQSTAPVKSILYEREVSTAESVETFARKTITSAIRWAEKEVGKQSEISSLRKALQEALDAS